MKDSTLNILLIFSGVFVGFLNGFLGGGGGILVVAILLTLLKLPQKKSHATAILVILPICVVSAGVYVFNGSVDWLKTLYATIGVICGGTVGAMLLKKMDNNVVKIIFAGLMIVAGVRMFF